MSRDYSYSSQVNRRLMATRFLITACDSHQTVSPVAAEKQAYIDSILLQLYFACVSYCNELLSHHQKPTLEDKGLNLVDVFDDQKQHFTDISQFNELRTLYRQKSSGLVELCRLFESLSAIGSKQEYEEDRVRRERLGNSPVNDATNYIPVATIDHIEAGQVKADLTDIKVIKKLLNDLQNLIDQQREYLLEY